MSVFKDLQADLDAVLETLIASGTLPSGADLSRAAVEPPRDPSHGDAGHQCGDGAGQACGHETARPGRSRFRLNSAKLRPGSSKAPRSPGPGFINLRLDRREVWLAGIAHDPDRIGPPITGTAPPWAAARTVNVEYVSDQSDGSDAYGSLLGERGGGRCAGVAARVFQGHKVRRNARISTSTMRVAQVDEARPLGPTCATARRSARISVKSRKACIRATI